jgi:hypothetical protein|tara:strand:- start:436 stop:642 length:207 start_codon:yes stop_codon:yes gene_type:complete
MSSISIEWLAQLPYEEQERVLSRLASADEELSPIEINGKRFYIPTEVIGLIDSLWAQLGNTDPFPQAG